MALHGVRDQNRLDGASNFAVWKARILSVLDRNRVKNFTLKVISVLVDPNDNDKYKEAMARTKCIILDGVKDHVVPHIAEKETTVEMWEALKNLYQHTFVHRRMVLENQMRSYQMKKGKPIGTFFRGLNEIRDQSTSIGTMPDQELMVRTSLNAVPEDWEVFVQSLLGRSNLLDWQELWAALRQEEIRRLSKAWSNSKGVRIKEEEEDAALASAGK